MSTYIKFTDDNSESLTHYGVKGMKWRHHKNNAWDLKQMYGINTNYNRHPDTEEERMDNRIRSGALQSKIRGHREGLRTRNEGTLKARPSLAPALKYNSERAKKTIDRLFSKAKKGLTKTINKKRSIDIGRHHLEYGRMNSRDASGRKHTRYVQYRRGGKPKYFRAF